MAIDGIMHSALGFSAVSHQGQGADDSWTTASPTPTYISLSIASHITGHIDEFHLRRSAHDIGENHCASLGRIHESRAVCSSSRVARPHQCPPSITLYPKLPKYLLAHPLCAALYLSPTASYILPVPPSKFEHTPPPSCIALRLRSSLSIR